MKRLELIDDAPNCEEALHLLKMLRGCRSVTLIIRDTASCEAAITLRRAGLIDIEPFAKNRDFAVARIRPKGGR